MVAEYWPAAQVGHEASFAVAEPFQPLPGGHFEYVWSAHPEEASVVDEYCPAMQGEHDASVVAEPAVKPTPRGHGDVECAMQGLALLIDE